VIRSVLIKAAIGIAVVGAAGASTALAASSPAGQAAIHSSGTKRAHAQITAGTVISASQQSLVVEKPGQKAHGTHAAVAPSRVTFTLNAATVITRGASKTHLAWSDLKAGQRVRVGVPAGATDKVARTVHILPLHTSGKITAISGSKVTIRHGAKSAPTDVVVTLGKDTVIRRAGSKDNLPASALAVGQSVGAEYFSVGAENDAVALHIQPDVRRGTVQALTAKGFTLATPGGTVNVITSATTRFKHRGPESPAPALKVGDSAVVRGSLVGADLQATRVDYGTPTAHAKTSPAAPAGTQRS
jgi:hypothetical protein